MQEANSYFFAQSAKAHSTAPRAWIKVAYYAYSMSD